MSSYLSHPDIPTVQIGVYPKRRRFHAAPFVPTPQPPQSSTGQPWPEAHYSDFFTPQIVSAQDRERTA